MSNETLTDPLGRIVTLYDRTWFAHVLRGHPEMRPHRRLATSAVENPIEIRYSMSDDNCRVYYGKGPRDDVMVAVIADVVSGIVKTAYLAKRTSPGGAEWS